MIESEVVAISWLKNLAINLIIILLYVASYHAILENKSSEFWFLILHFSVGIVQAVVTNRMKNKYVWGVPTILLIFLTLYLAYPYISYGISMDYLLTTTEGGLSWAIWFTILSLIIYTPLYLFIKKWRSR